MGMLIIGCSLANTNSLPRQIIKEGKKNLIIKNAGKAVSINSLDPSVLEVVEDIKSKLDLKNSKKVKVIDIVNIEASNIRGCTYHNMVPDGIPESEFCGKYFMENEYGHLHEWTCYKREWHYYCTNNHCSYSVDVVSHTIDHEDED